MMDSITSPDESGRLAALAAYAVMDSPVESDFDDLTRIAAYVCKTPIALISLVDDRRQWFKSRVGLAVTETPRDMSFCAYALHQAGPLVVADATRDPRFDSNPLVIGDPQIRFYAGAPLVTPEGHTLGTLCVIDREPRDLSPERLEALQILSRQVMTQLNLRRRASELAARERLLRAIFEAEPDCVTLLADNGNIRLINRAGLALLEATSVEDATGRAFATAVAAPDRARFSEFIRRARQGHSGTLDFAMTGLRGTSRYLTMHAVPLHDDEGQVTDVLGIARDITARAAADAERDQLMQLIERSRDFIATADLAGRITFMNAGGREMIGLSATADVGAVPFTEYVPETWQAFFRDTVIPGALTQGVWEGEMQLRHVESGALIDVSRTVFVIPDAEGAPRSLATVTRDVTTRKKAELALRDSEAGLVAAQSRAHLGSWELSATGTGVWSAEMSRLHYRDPARDAPAFDEFVNLIHSDDRAALLRMHAETATMTEPVTLEYRTNPASGPVRHLMATIEVSKDAQGQLTHIVGTTLDITALKHSEGRFRRLVDSNAQGVLFWNRHGQITGANDAFLHIVGYSREDLDAGRLDWAAMTPPEHAWRDVRALEELSATGVCTPFEKEYLRKDGTRVPILLGAALFEDSQEDGVCFVVELTERKKLEQQFLRAQRMESIGTLAGGIAHDLNNVLMPILMSVDLLKLNMPADGDRDLLEIIRESAQRGADLVRQVLLFARGIEGRRIDVHVAHLIRDIEKIVNETFFKHIEVRTIIPAGLWSIIGDPTQLHQVLLNLCLNARDAMLAGGLLTITAENRMLDAQYVAMNPEATPGPHVTLQVEDSGAGIPAAIVERIFDPFFTTKEFGKGTGLGLSTTLAIVKSHGGFLRVYSEVGKGSKMLVYLPAHQVSSADVPERAAEVAELPRGHDELVLVVDDEASVRQITQHTLEAFGYRVLVAEDGAAAVAIYATRGSEIAVVLTDMMMPVMDGLALIQVLRKLNPAVQIIAASGLSANGHVAKASSFGVDHFLPKPYTADVMLNLLRRVLRPDADVLTRRTPSS